MHYFEMSKIEYIYEIKLKKKLFICSVSETNFLHNSIKNLHLQMQILLIVKYLLVIFDVRTKITNVEYYLQSITFLPDKIQYEVGN